MLNKLNMYMPLQNNLWDVFQSWTLLYPSSIFACIWKCIPAITIWTLWWERNKRIFYQEFSLVDKVEAGIEKSVSEIVNAATFKVSFNFFSSWDSYIIRDWKSILIPSGSSPTSKDSKAFDRALVNWSPPSNGFVKINSDGSSRGNLGKSGIDACIRDYHGEVLAIKTSPLPPGTNNLAEAHGLLSRIIVS